MRDPGKKRTKNRARPPAKHAVKRRPAKRAKPAARPRPKTKPRPPAKRKPVPPPPAPPIVRVPVGDAARAAAHREAVNVRQKADSAALRDIAAGYPGGPADPGRREACREDLERGLRTYFPRAFPKPFCRDHRRLIARSEEAMRGGGLYAKAMFRGSGKTTLFTRIMLLAELYGYRRFGVIVGATQRDAQKIARQVKEELWQNELLMADFPEVCYPLACLEDNARRAKGQLWQGAPTLVEWHADMVVFASVPPSAVGGSIFVARAITGAIKGLQHRRADGTIIRPDFVLLDDVQTRKSAKSLTATEDRIQLIDGDILGLAGHDVPITAVMAITPIYDGDLACTYLDREKKPQWQGETSAMVYTMPTREDLWDQYRQIDEDARKNDGDPQAARRFYAEHRAEMDAGAEVAWPENFPAGRLSALQYAMDLKFRSPLAFAGEYQCKPLVTAVAPGLMLKAEAIAQCTSGLAGGLVPSWAEHLTAMIDVHDHLLYYAVCAWKKDFTGTVVDYGTLPAQGRRYFSLDDANPTLASYLATIKPELAGSPPKVLIAAGLDLLYAELLSHVWRREDEQPASIERLLTDTGYEKDVVCGAIRRLRQPALTTPLAMPSRGVGVTATKKPFSAYTKKPGDLVGWHWRAPRPEPGQLRCCDVDTNHFKSVLHQSLMVAPGRPGHFTLYGDRRTDHALLADHLTAETPKRVESKTDDREVTQWEQKPGRDNHWFDCLIGCYVGAAMLGCTLHGAEDPEARSRPRKRVSLAQVAGAT